MDASLPRSSESFSHTLNRLRSKAEGTEASLSLKQVVEVFGPKGHALLILFLNLPFCQPIPIPGVSSALGFCMMIIAYFMILNRPPWIPERLARISIDKKFLVQIAARLEALMKRFEHVIRPRGRVYFQQRSTQITTGLLLCFHAFLLSLPLPIPFSNFFPAIALLLLSLGTLEEDGVVMALGYVAVIACTVFFAALVVLPYLTVKSMA